LVSAHFADPINPKKFDVRLSAMG